MNPSVEITSWCLEGVGSEGSIAHTRNSVEQLRNEQVRVYPKLEYTLVWIKMGVSRSVQRLLGLRVQDEEKPETLGLPVSDYSMVSPIIVRQHEIDSFRKLLEKETSSPKQTIKNSKKVSDGPRDSDFVEQYEEMVTDVEEILDVWESTTGAKIGIGYVPMRAPVVLYGFYKHCERRDRAKRDSFQFPDGASVAESFAQRVTQTVTGNYPMVAAPSDAIPEI